MRGAEEPRKKRTESAQRSCWGCRGVWARYKVLGVQTALKLTNWPKRRSTEPEDAQHLQQCFQPTVPTARNPFYTAT